MRCSLAILLLSVVALFGRPCSAHPFLQGAIQLSLSEDSVVLRLRETLRPAVLSGAAEPKSGAFFSREEVDEFVNSHAQYLLAHLEVRSGTELLRGRVRAAGPEGVVRPVHPFVDLETRHAVYEFKYALAAPPSLISLEHEVLADVQSDEVWQTTYLVTVVYAGRGQTVANGLLTTELGFDFEPRWQELDRRHGDTSRISFSGFVAAGIEHILMGWDHLLFVGALVIVARRLLDIVKVVLAFTFAHSLTLALASLGVLALPSLVVEPLIALSIVVVAVQNLLWKDGGGAELRLASGFGFGLVHGLGFAGPLIDALENAPGAEIAKGIIAFSLGVEIGHQVIVLPLTLLVLWVAHKSADLRRPLVQVGSLLIAIGGVVFLVRAV